jgi:glucose-6-phosphate 1-epimerase
MELQSLNDHFGIPGVLAFDSGQHGLPRAVVTSPACTAELYLRGAHLTAWQPADEEPVLFLSEASPFQDGKAIRGGVPIIFPWFGARTATPDSTRTDGPAHGFARISAWQVSFAAVSGDDLHLALTLEPNDASRALGYDHFKLAFELVLGKELRMRLTVANLGTTPLHFEEALHTYFTVGDVSKFFVEGLAGAEFIDKTDNFARKTQHEPTLTLTGETDRLYLNTQSTVALHDAVLDRTITVAKANSNSTVVWNPWAELSRKMADMTAENWRRMACIETANAAENALTLAAGEAHTMEARVSVQRSGHDA